MQIEIIGAAERFVQAALASGEYSSAEGFIAAMATAWQRKSSDIADNAFPITPERIDSGSFARRVEY